MLRATKSVVRSEGSRLAARLSDAVNGIVAAVGEAVRDAAFGLRPAPALVPVRVRPARERARERV